jgi:hypothetical protein
MNVATSRPKQMAHDLVSPVLSILTLFIAADEDVGFAGAPVDVDVRSPVGPSVTDPVLVLAVIVLPPESVTLTGNVVNTAAGTRTSTMVTISYVVCAHKHFGPCVVVTQPSALLTAPSHSPVWYVARYGTAFFVFVAARLASGVGINSGSHLVPSSNNPRTCRAPASRQQARLSKSRGKLMGMMPLGGKDIRAAQVCNAQDVLGRVDDGAITADGLKIGGVGGRDAGRVGAFKFRGCLGDGVGPVDEAVHFDAPGGALCDIPGGRW